MTDDSCLFCRMVAGEIPVEKVAETHLTLAFRDSMPQAPTHVLVIPKVHRPTLAELAETHAAEVVDVLVVARQVADADGVGDRYRLVCNNGSAAGQSVFHAHVHVLGGRELSWPPG